MPNIKDIKDINSNSLVSYSNLNESATHTETIEDFEGVPLGPVDHNKIHDFPNFWLFIHPAGGVVDPASEITDTRTVPPYISGHHFSTSAVSIRIEFKQPVTQFTFAAASTINGNPEDYLLHCYTVDGELAELTLSGDAQWHTLTVKGLEKITDFSIYQKSSEAINFRFDNLSVQL